METDIDTNVFRVVVTGPPGSGKTTTIDLLRELGCVVFPEAARELIRLEQRGDNRVFPWTELSEFVDRLWKVQIAQFEDRVQSAGPVFYDRGLPDALAFLRFHDAESPSGYRDACVRCRYSVVFNLAMPSTYSRDAQRPYDRNDSNELGLLNETEYRDLGYELVNCPSTAALDRAHHVLARTARFMSCQTTDYCPQEG